MPLTFSVYRITPQLTGERPKGANPVELIVGRIRFAEKTLPPHSGLPARPLVRAPNLDRRGAKRASLDGRMFRALDSANGHALPRDAATITNFVRAAAIGIAGQQVRCSVKRLTPHYDKKFI
jgi:hypothetical protein